MTGKELRWLKRCLKVTLQRLTIATQIIYLTENNDFPEETRGNIRDAYLLTLQAKGEIQKLIKKGKSK